MLLRAIFIFLFASLTFATKWKYKIYVSSSFGVNTTSCWTEGDQTPCATLNLALQGLQYNSTVIYLYPGTYILDNTIKVIDKSNVAIVGHITKDGGKTVTIKCSSHSGLLFLSSTNIILKSLVLDSCGDIQINPNREFDFQVSAVYISMCYNVQLIDIILESGNNSTGLNQYSSNKYGNTLDIANEMWECPCLKLKMLPYNYNLDNNTIFSGVTFYICASIYDCNNETFYWKNDLEACVVSGPASFYSNQQCSTIYYDCSTDSFAIILFDNNRIYSGEVLLLIQTNLSIIQTLQSNLSINLKQSTKQSTNFTNSRTGKCDLGYGVPINQLDKCVQCDQHPPIPGWVMFILIQLIPLTIVVLIIIVFNIQLTNGFMIGLVFYFQMISVVYPNLSLNFVFDSNHHLYNYDCSINNIKWYIIPWNIFNLDFLTFLSHPLFITSNMAPLQAIFFWYIIPTYPLVLLLLIYSWITMYDKGFRCVVTITRPLHRLLARFWRMTNIEPSLIHSIASIYLLCFTQFAATSLQLLYPTTWYVWNSTYPSFDNRIVKHFSRTHSFAGIFAIIVLVFIIFLPMLYIQLYPFKIFHKFLRCLHLRKEILISLSDIFTGPYNNGSDNTRDYRCFAGFYFVLRIIILCLYLIPYELEFFSQFIILCFQIGLFGLFGGMIMIFRPHKNNLQNFSNLIIFLFLMAASGIALIADSQPTIDAVVSQVVIVTFSGILVFGIFISVVVWTVKKIASICVYCRVSSNSSLIEEHAEIQPLLKNDDNWNADRIEHPDDYDEHHIQYVPYDLTVSPPQDITGRATYGSISNPELSGTCNSDSDLLSTRDTQSTVAVSHKLSIPLHPIANEPDDNTITDNVG